MWYPWRNSCTLGRSWGFGLSLSGEQVIDEAMTATVDVLGEVIEVDLLPGGAGVPVTNENKAQFANLKVCRRRF